MPKCSRQVQMAIMNFGCWAKKTKISAEKENITSIPTVAKWFYGQMWPGHTPVTACDVYRKCLKSTLTIAASKKHKSRLDYVSLSDLDSISNGPDDNNTQIEGPSEDGMDEEPNSNDDGEDDKPVQSSSLQQWLQQQYHLV
ncbi:hypothetical protein BDR07DRAFT_1372977 [Suillus spraguei]|nr:hypothetical protein BDR07DRAFT_1372977 [Suillus spraguei]